MSDYDSFDDDGEDIGLLKKALDVELPENFDPHKVPETGEEYLQHVMYERTKCKTWITVDIDRSKFKDKQTFKIELDNPIKETAQALLPSMDWQVKKVEDFINFRKYIQFKLSSLPQQSTVSAFEETTFLENFSKEPPKFSHISQYTQAVKIRMLQIISKDLDTIKIGASFEKTTGTWIYAILVLLEIPLSPSSCHTLREFAKKCRIIRSNLSENAEEVTYNPLNLFICIVARFYNQLDLADP